MSLYHFILGFFRKCNNSRSIYGNVGSRKISVRNVCSLHSYACRKPRRREGSKRIERASKEKLASKVYMRNVVMNISNILRYSSWDSAQEELGRLPVKWDSYTVNQVLKTHPPMEKAWLFFNWTSKLKSFKLDKFTYTTMLDIFGEAGRMNSMKYVFQLMKEKGINIDVVTYTSLLHWLSNNGNFDEAVNLWREMKANGCHPTVVSYTAFMKILFDNNKVQEATEIYKEMLQSGLTPSCHTYTIIMENLISSGKCQSALEVFRQMQETGVEPDKAACNILVEKCCKAGQASPILQILDYMKKKSLVLRYPVYVQARETLKMAGEDNRLLLQVNPHICIQESDGNDVLELEQAVSDRNYFIDRGILVEFLRKKNFIAVDLLVSGMVHQHRRLDTEIISQIIEVNCTCGRTFTALWLLKYSNNVGIFIEVPTCLSLLGVLIRGNEFSKITELVKHLVKIDLFLQPKWAPTLIYRLGQSGELGIALEVFHLLPEQMKSTTVYTALISAFFSSGDPDKAIETYKSMKSRDIHVAKGTYNVVIRGLEMFGRLDEARLYQKEYRNFQMEVHIPEATFMEEKICDVLFDGYMVR